MSDLESSDANSIVSKKETKKRRSSVFKRQSIVPLQNQDFDNNDKIKEISHESKKFKSQEDEEPKFRITEYIELLMKEDKNWRDEYAKRKTRTRELTKRTKIVQKLGQILDITALSDSERAFLAAKPDYEEFNKNLFQLHETATKVTFLNKFASNLHEKSTKKLEYVTANAVHRIIGMED